MLTLTSHSRAMTRCLIGRGHPVLLEHILCLRQLLLVVLSLSLDIGLDLLVGHEFLDFGSHVVLWLRP